MQPGDVIDGKYEVELLVGEGGMGSVVAATHRVLGTTVAIKILKPEGARNPEVAKRFIREARAASRLRSEHVAHVTDIGALPTGEPYMVMQMLHGADLAAIVANGPLPPGTAADYIIQACEGLAEAHSLGMVHRDIKPGNLFLTQRPNGEPLIKVLDFGIATAAHGEVDRSLTMTNMVMGSPNYMSPEQLRSTRSVDARSDIWSLGITLYELIAGRNPFEGQTFTALTIAIATEPHVTLSMVVPELAGIVDRCLTKNPDERYQNVAELAAALTPFADRTPGRSNAAVRVASALHSAVPPTLYPGLGGAPGTGARAMGSGSVARGSTPQTAGHWQPAPSAPYAYTPPPMVNPTTSQFTSGESVESAAVKPSRKGWIVAGLLLGAAAIAAVVAFTVMRDDGKVATNDPPAKQEPAKQEPAKQEPAKQEPAKQEPAKQEPAKQEPTKTVEPSPAEVAAAHVQAAEQAFADAKPDAALDELLAIDDLHGADVSRVVPFVDKLRQKASSEKIKKVVALLDLPPLKRPPVIHRPPPPPPPHHDVTPLPPPPHHDLPPPPPPHPPKTGCSPSDPKCGL